MKIFRKARAFGVLSVVSLMAAVSIPADGAVLLVEDFHNATVTSPDWVSGGTGGAVPTDWEAAQACLTAGTAIAGTPIPGCAAVAIDPAGSGFLRLTPAADDRAGFALYNSALPTAGGIDFSFHQYQWGGSGADGIAIFFVDGAASLTTPGKSGGALGYSTDGVTPGVTGGLLGIGLDAFGNFSEPSEAAGTGCAGGSGPGSGGPGPAANRVVVRGPGTGTTGYCWLGSSSAVTLRGVSRAASDATIRIVLDPSTAATRNVTVYLNGTQVVQVPAPAELLAASTFKFGFTASTGGSTDNHEISGLTIGEAPPTVAPTPVKSVVKFTG